MQDMMVAIVAAAGIPSAVVGFAFWILERKIAQREAEDKEERKKRQAEADERENRREEFEFCVLQSVNAAVALSEATARAVQRIPDAHCNGDMTEALEYASKVKREQKNFLFRQGIKNVM